MMWRCGLERVPQQKYTKEFREQAVELVLEQELTIPEAAIRLAMSDKTLAKGVFQARLSQLPQGHHWDWDATG
jgi:transposase-like protein